MDTLSEIGVPAIVALLLLREVFSFLKEKNGNGHTKHYVYESSKVMGSLEVEMRRLSHSINNLGQIINNLHHEIKETRADVKEIKEELRS